MPQQGDEPGKAAFEKNHSVRDTAAHLPLDGAKGGEKVERCCEGSVVKVVTRSTPYTQSSERWRQRVCEGKRIII